MSPELALSHVAADEWGRYVHHPRSSDEFDLFAVEYNGHNDSLLGEHFTVGDEWDDTERLTFELTRMGRHDTLDIDSHWSSGHKPLHPGDFDPDCSGYDGSRLPDMAFDVSRCPLAPSDVNDDGRSDDIQISLRTPEDGEVLPPTSPVQIRRGSTQYTTCSAPQPPLVSRVSSSRPRSRNTSAQFSSAPSISVQTSHPPTPPTPPLSAYSFDYRNMQVDEFIASRLAHLEQICTALEIVRGRAREEGWRLIRATLIGAKNGWMDTETERCLEIKAKRRAWSSGIKISAPYSTSSRSTPRVWDGSFRSPMRPPGLTSSSTAIPQVRGPIVPTGLSLGIPVRSSPLAMYAWAADDGQKHTPSKYGILNPAHRMETIEGKRISRVTFADSLVTKLFPVCEDEGEDSFKPIEANAVNFPQAVPLTVSAEEPDCGLTEGPAGREDDPFYFCPSQPRMRTTSMYMISPAPSAPSPVLPMFRPSTPPPSYQVAIGGDVIAATNEGGKPDASALLLQPLSSLAISPSSQSSSSRPPPTFNLPFVPRPRAVSLPTLRSCASTNKTRRTSFDYKEEHCEDLSQAYASPPPEGPLVITATPAPHEQYPRYAHVYSPISASKKSMNATILGRTGKEVVFEQAGSGFTVGIEVALGRAEEGRVVW